MQLPEPPDIGTFALAIYSFILALIVSAILGALGMRFNLRFKPFSPITLVIFTLVIWLLLFFGQ